MFVEFTCGSCGKQLRVPSQSAGDKAACPSCGGVNDVPGGPSSESPEDDSWKVRTPEGDVYGPVTKTELDRWLADGRLSASCHIMHGGGPQWRSAADIYPKLSSAGRPSSVAGTAGSYVPPPANPYESPTAHAAATYSSSSFARPHRGAMVLVFGILGIVLCPCFAPFAWVMGRNDMDSMNAGVMDRSGYGLTQAGWICGIIGTVIILLQIGGFVLVFGIMAITG